MLRKIIKRLIEHDAGVKNCSVCSHPVPIDHLSTPDFRIDAKGHFCSQMCYRTFMIMYDNGDID